MPKPKRQENTLTDEWDGTERRMHNCVQQIPINDIKNDVKTIMDCVERQEKETSKVYKLLFGEDLKGGLVTSHSNVKQSLFRVWWLAGFIAFAIIGTGIRVWFF